MPRYPKGASSLEKRWIDQERAKVAKARKAVAPAREKLRHAAANYKDKWLHKAVVTYVKATHALSNALLRLGNALLTVKSNHSTR